MKKPQFPIHSSIIKDKDDLFDEFLESVHDLLLDIINETEVDEVFEQKESLGNLSKEILISDKKLARICKMNLTLNPSKNSDVLSFLTYIKKNLKEILVLEFKGPSPSSHSNLTSLKVSMGKRVFRTWDTGDFSFPLTTLRDNLVVTLVDTEENEIAHTGIQTMAIIEKGCWDEIFSLEGGWHVHMKLQFVLSEEDRNRIRIMRESAMKKKHDTNPNINLRHSEITGSPSDPVETSISNEPVVSDSRTRSIKIEVISHEVVALQAGSLAKSATSTVHPQSDYRNREGSTLESAIPNATDQSEGASSSPVRHGVNSQFPQVDQKEPVEKLETHMPLAPIRSTPVVDQEVSSKSESATEISEKSTSAISKMQHDPIHKYENQGPLEKTPSNVRKMISAFESNLVQDVKSPRKTPSVQSQFNRGGKEGTSTDQDSNVVNGPANPSLKELEDHFITGIVHQIPASISKREDIFLGDTEPSQAAQKLLSSVTPVSSKGKDSKVEDISRDAQGELTVKEWKKSPFDLMKPSALETATSSGRMHKDQSRDVRAYDFSAKPLGSSNSSAVEGGNTRTGLESSTKLNIQVASNQKTNSLECYEEEYYSSESSGMWIFPDNTRSLCITTAGNKVRKILGRQRIEARTRQEKKYSSKSQIAEKCNLPFRNEHETKKGQRKFSNQQESEPGSSPDDESSGLVGQVIKIVIILGFGAFVFLTRQKEPRKSKREENFAFPIGTTLTRGQ
ncbi:uncharacterized protein Fot_35188 [Forsythia ovata]|uniref:Uncharacterized protein n=1 Tax=Forsythia ovata TaxID=205694 RepID=A0ABD1SKT6_9LAMI